MIGYSNDETNCQHKLLLTDRQVANLCKAFANYLPTDIKLSKTQLSKMVQLGGLFDRLLGPFLKARLPLTKNAIKPLAESVLIPLGLTAAASAAYAGILLGSASTTLIISNDEMEDIIKIVQSLEDSGLLLKRVNESIQNEVKEQKGGFLSMLLVTLGASLLGNLLTGKGAFHTRKRVNKKSKGIHRAGEGIVKAGEGNMDF